MRVGRANFVVAGLAVALAACAGRFGPAPVESAAGGGPGAGSRAGVDLVGRWQLVRIVPASGEALVPDDARRCVIEFLEEGHVALRADCNVARGGWSAEPPDRVRIGPLSATRAMCGPASLGPRFLRALARVRSFVREDGRLRLAGEGGGDALEFVPFRSGSGGGAQAP